MNDAAEPSDPLHAVSEAFQPEKETERPVSGPLAAGLPESEHSAAEHAFPTDRPLEKWMKEAHG